MSNNKKKVYRKLSGPIQMNKIATLNKVFLSLALFSKQWNFTIVSAVELIASEIQEESSCSLNDRYCVLTRRF